MSDKLKDGEKFQRGMEKFQRGWEGSLIGLLCSRNARSRTPLVGRAQWETDSGHPPGGGTSELGRTILWSWSMSARCDRSRWPWSPSRCFAMLLRKKNRHSEAS